MNAFEKLRSAFNAGRLTAAQRKLCWTLQEIRRVRADLRGLSEPVQRTPALRAMRLLQPVGSGRIDRPEWAMVNRRGTPVPKRPQYFA